jgi:hypothetical protein
MEKEVRVQVKEWIIEKIKWIIALVQSAEASMQGMTAAEKKAWVIDQVVAYVKAIDIPWIPNLVEGAIDSLLIGPIVRVIMTYLLGPVVDCVVKWLNATFGHDAITTPLADDQATALAALAQADLAKGGKSEPAVSGNKTTNIDDRIAELAAKYKLKAA